MDRTQRWIDKPGWRPPAMTTPQAVLTVLLGLSVGVALMGVGVALDAPSWLSMDLGILTWLVTLYAVGRSPRKR